MYTLFVYTYGFIFIVFTMIFIIYDFVHLLDDLCASLVYGLLECQ